jgi:hypothetical protein
MNLPIEQSLKDSGDFVIFTTDDGKCQIECRLVDGTIWLTQALIGEVFQKNVRTINEHLKNIYAELELDEGATIRKFRIVRFEGTREVSRLVEHYNLDAILAVGFRVKSARGTEFRRWANTQLKELLTKGFVMNDEQLKNPGKWDYFDELLERIREIRASEKRFYQKVRDLFALSVDYKDRQRDTNTFFAEVQNKLIYAVANKTAAELVVAR